MKDARKSFVKALERGVEGRDTTAGEVQLRVTSRRVNGAFLGEDIKIKAGRRLHRSAHGGWGESVGGQPFARHQIYTVLEIT